MILGSSSLDIYNNEVHDEILSEHLAALNL